MRVILFTGKGGVGKTTTAAASAVQAARDGLRTLIISTDPAHSLGDILAVPLGDQPSVVADNLAAMQVDAQSRFESAWGEIAGYLRRLVEHTGVDPMTADEITVLPGAEELMSLLALREQAESDQWDLIVVDCAPTADTLRLLSLPSVLSWYVERLAPTQSRVLRSVSPALRRLRDVPAPPQGIGRGLGDLQGALGALHDLLSDAETTSVRMVMTPELASIAESRRTHTTLMLYGFHVDAAIVNRVVPAGGQDPWRRSWVAAQADGLAQIEQSFAGIPVRTVQYWPGEPVGVADLGVLGAELYGSDDVSLGTDPAPMLSVTRVTADAPGGADFVLRLELPTVEEGPAALARSGSDLIVTVAGRRRYVALPSALRRCEVVSARRAEDAVEIRFTPDADLWPAS